MSSSPQVCSTFRWIFPLWKIIDLLIPDSRLSDSLPGAELGLLGRVAENLSHLPPGLIVSLGTTAWHQRAPELPPHRAGCTQRVSHLLIYSSWRSLASPRARRNPCQCWSSPNTGPAHEHGQPCSVLAWAGKCPLPLEWGGHHKHPCWAALACVASLYNPQPGTDRVHTTPFSLVQKITVNGLKSPLIFISEIQISNANK